MKRYIDADAVIFTLNKIAEKHESDRANMILVEMVRNIVDSAPTADVMPIVYGYWMKRYNTASHDYNEDNNWDYYCSNCNRFTTRASEYCPFCGATMTSVRRMVLT